MGGFRLQQALAAWRAKAAERGSLRRGKQRAQRHHSHGLLQRAYKGWVRGCSRAAAVRVGVSRAVSHASARSLWTTFRAWRAFVSRRQHHRSVYDALIAECLQRVLAAWRLKARRRVR